MGVRETFLALSGILTDVLYFPVYVDPVWYNLVRRQWDTVLILTFKIQYDTTQYEHSGHTALILMRAIQYGTTRYEHRTHLY
jgi:hypothetical protein